ncbi:MAG: pyridoxamine 5'-phosphate oxidase family protein [Clostridiales bacterium]|nr:pyridoxamine 5'-phosphate oxidase family protein [Clostridiales bacterium]
MIDYNTILKENPNGVLATTDGCKAKTRVFQYLFSEENKVYFCTSNEKPVYGQLRANPYASFCTYPSNFAPVLSVSGSVTFVGDLKLKARALDENPGIQGIYKTPENPVFELFYLNVEEVETFSFAEGPKSYTV